MGDNIIRGYEEAVHEISKAYYFMNTDKLNSKYEYDNKFANQYPYFFITGSGISTESVKTTSQIISECKKICGENKTAIDGNGGGEYSYWLERAFPHKETRRRYIENLVKDKKIPESVMKLADILMSRKISNLVVTTNFDTFIYDSLKTFGENDILMAENNESIRKLDIESNSVNILHVYGTYEFYDLFSKYYLERKDAEENNLFSVKNFLRTTLNKMSPIVIGYSGRENDIIMSELKERLNIPLKYKMYWFCHTEEDYNNLPMWLKYSDVEKKIERDDVIFILPECIENYNISNDEDLKYMSFTERLNAKDVLSSFINEFDIKSPEIIQNPIRFLKNYFENRFSKNVYSELLLLRFDDSESDSEILDIKDAILNNNIRDIIIKTEGFIKNLSAHEEKDIRTLLHYLVIAVEEHAAVGFKQSDLTKLINLYNEIYKSIEASADNTDKLNFIKMQLEEILTLKSDNVIRQRLEGVLKDLNSINEDNYEYRSVYRKCINLKLMYSKETTEALYDDIINKINEWNDPEDIKLLVKMYIEKGIYLENNNNLDQALIMFENAEKYFTSILDNKWLEPVFILCKLRRASLFNELEKYDDALLEIEDVKTKFYDSEDVKIKSLLADAMILRGKILKKTMKLEEAEAAFDEVYDKFNRLNDENVRRKAVKALFNKAEVLEADENYYDAVEVYNDIIGRYQDDKDKELRIDAIQAKLNKIIILTKSEKDELIIKKCNEVLKEYEHETDERIKLITLQVRLCKAIGLHNRGKQKEAMDLYNDIIKARKEDADIKMKSLIMEARIFKSYCLKDDSNDIDTKEMCNELISLCKSDEDKKSKTQVVEVMLNQADSLIKSGNVEEGLKVYDEIEVSYKDNVNVIRVVRELIKSMAKTNFNTARLLYERLRYNCSDSPAEVEDEVLLSEFIILVNNTNAEFDTIQSKALELSVRNDNIKGLIEGIVGNIGTEAYINKNLDMAEKYYYLLYSINNDMCLNLAYMIRRREVSDPNIYPDCELLIENAALYGNDLAYINKALILIDRERYDEAISYIRKVNNVSAFEWWKHMDNGDSEKYVVLFMGVVTGKISESEFNINDLIEKLEEFHKNDLILHIERVIYLENQN